MVVQRRSRVFFTIDTDNEIVAHETAPAAQDGAVVFSTEKEFAKAAAEWSMSRLVETWNGFAGVAGTFGDLKPVKKFMDRPTAIKRIWKVIQRLADAVRKTAEEAKAKATKPVHAKAAPREGTAKATVLAMIQRQGGATLDEIRAATGWQPHTVRGFISVAPRRAGLTVTSTRRASDKARVYEAH